MSEELSIAVIFILSRFFNSSTVQIPVPQPISKPAISSLGFNELTISPIRLAIDIVLGLIKLMRSYEEAMGPSKLFSVESGDIFYSSHAARLL